MSVPTDLQVVRNAPTASSESQGAQRATGIGHDLCSVSLLPLAQSLRHFHLGYLPSRAGGQGEQGHHCAGADEDPAQT